MTNDDYFESMISEFPSLSQQILEEDAELIHLRMEIFADYTIEQINTKNETELLKCFNFQASRIDLMNADLMNALMVSYCESLLLGECADKMKQIKQLLPTKLFDIYTDYENWYDNLVEKKQI